MRLEEYLSHEREILTGPTGTAFDLSLTEEWARESAAFGNSAAAFLTTAIRCRLVGLEEECFTLLERSLKWVRIAIAEKERPERYALGGTEAQRYQVLALGQWLQHGTDDAEALRLLVEAEDQFLSQSPLRHDMIEVSLVTPWYLYAGAHQRAIELIQGVRKKPNATSEVGVVMALAEGRLRGQPVPPANLADPMLRKEVPKWLGAGHQMRAALWMRLVFGGRNGSPVKITRRCLEYLKG